MPKERPLDYVPIHVSIRRHKKTRRLKRLLGSAATVPIHWYLIEFFLECAEEYPDGTIGKLGAEDIADMAHWPGEPELFLDGLVASGYLAQGSDGFMIPTWPKYGGRVIERRASDRKRQRRRRQNVTRDNGDVTRDNGDVTRDNRDVTVVSHGNPQQSTDSKSKSKRKNTHLARSVGSRPISGEGLFGSNGSKSDPKSKQSADIQTVWKAYQEYHPRMANNLKSNDSRHSVIKKALANYSVQDLIKCIRGYEGDPWWSANHSKIGTYLRNSENIDRGIELAEKPRKPTNGKPTDTWSEARKKETLT